MLLPLQKKVETFTRTVVREREKVFVYKKFRLTLYCPQTNSVRDRFLGNLHHMLVINCDLTRRITAQSTKFTIIIKCSGEYVSYPCT